jgi:hypothetical protein
MNKNEPENALFEIKQMMEKSSRFISLSGLSGIAAGICALVGALYAYPVIRNAEFSQNRLPHELPVQYEQNISIQQFTGNSLFIIALTTFIAAVSLAFFFTYLRSKKTNTPLWGKMAQRLMINVSLPLAAGAIYLFRLIQIGTYGLVAPGCLIFYGLALLNAGKYTLKEIRYLGLSEILLGVVSLWYMHRGLYFWAIGFGVLHIIYGLFMWWRYEK